MITGRRNPRTCTATGRAMAAPGLPAPAIAQGAKDRTGFVSPQPAPLAGFAESDDHNIRAFVRPRPGATRRSSSRTA